MATRNQAYAGYIPWLALSLGAGLGGWIASRVGIPEWTLAGPGVVGGYYLSRTILRRVYANEDE